MQRPMLARFWLGSVLLLVLLAPISAQSVSTNQNPPTPPLGELVDVGGYRVHLYCTGTGSPTVVIVGAGFSVDWGLVQPEVAKLTRVCSYDHSGIGWSDDGPKDSCALRVGEVHTALKNAGVQGPYVLVGHSLGGLIARLYAGRFPDEVAGIVFVDHAMSIKGRLTLTLLPGLWPGLTLPPPTPPDGTAVGPSGGPKLVGLEDDPNFSKLPSQDREAHVWFMAQPRNQKALQSNAEIVPQCLAEADALVKEHSQPLGGKPLVDVDTNQSAAAELQTQLLSLSRNSKEMVADKSGHYVIIDRPDVVVNAVSQVVRSARNKTPL
jgi:pimeloyl-ACP methyl ester carboxylesterase